MANPNPLATPTHCTADFSLVPIGTHTPSISAQIADVQRLMKTSGLVYSMHSAGTTVVRKSPSPFSHPFLFFFLNLPKPGGLTRSASLSLGREAHPKK